MRKPNTIGYDVDYDVLDAFKRDALAAAEMTSFRAVAGLGFKEVPGCRGESVYLVEAPGMILAFVVEGLGTLSEIARDMLELTGMSYMTEVSRANFATIVNDLTACGAYPLVANSFISVGDESWFADPAVRSGMIQGWRLACNQVGCSWGGGETQKLRDIVNPQSAVLGGAAMGIIRPKSRLIRGNIRNGDKLVAVNSSGIHANGVTMARDVAKSLPRGYLTKLPNGQTYGNALLASPHMLYAQLIEAALDAKIRLRYVTNITGHGWRKVMRLDKPWTYVIEKLPEPHPVFRFIQECAGVSDQKMYETFNMAVGCVFVVDPRGDNTDRMLHLVEQYGFKGQVIGHVEKGPRRVVIPKLGVTFESAEYQVR